MAYLNFDTSILVWGDFQKYEVAFNKIINGSIDTNIPYQSETGLIQLMLSILYHTRDEVATFWITSSLIENYDLR